MTFIRKNKLNIYARQDLKVFEDKNGQLKFPLNLESVAKVVFNLDIGYEDFIDVGIQKKDEEYIFGALFPDDIPFQGDDKLILVNSRSKELNIGDYIYSSDFPEEAQRFTIAHEIGHYSIHFLPNKNQGLLFSTNNKLNDIFNRKGARYCRSAQRNNTRYDPIEIQANIYASALLMPVDEVENVLGKNDRIIDLNEWDHKLKNHFGVSYQALEYRLNYLKYKTINNRYSG